VECPVCLLVVDTPEWACKKDLRFKLKHKSLLSIRTGGFLFITPRPAKAGQFNYTNYSLLRNCNSSFTAASVSGRMRRSLKYNIKAFCPKGREAFMLGPN